jgi:molybdopterin-guanine dinucleotide biosynthesis protein A
LGYQQEQRQATTIKYSDSIRESRILWQKMQEENNKKNILLDLSDPLTIVFSQPLSDDFFLNFNSLEGLEKISERARGAKADFKRQYSFFL